MISKAWLRPLIAVSIGKALQSKVRCTNRVALADALFVASFSPSLQQNGDFNDNPITLGQHFVHLNGELISLHEATAPD